MASFFEHRGKWRAQVTLPSGQRRTKEFALNEKRKAQEWARGLEAEAIHSAQPALGGPTAASVAAMLREYANDFTAAKKGCDQELTRINHYLEGAGMPVLWAERIDDQLFIRETSAAALAQCTPKGLRKWIATRRDKRARTFEAMATLARKPVSQVTRGDITKLMTAMTTDGLSSSSIQKEIALLKHAFNMARDRWNWVGFSNPCVGLKLGKSNTRFVKLTSEEWDRLWAAVAECENPYIWPLIDCAIFLTARQKSLLAMTWDRLDLEGRVADLDTKTGQAFVPLALRVKDVLSSVPRDSSGRVFPLTQRAVESAWRRVRARAGLPKLQFRDLRHLGATYYARRLLNPHMLQEILGHKTPHMANVYVNLTKSQTLEALDRSEGMVSSMPPPPSNLAKTTEDRVLARRVRVARLGVEARLAARTDSSSPERAIPAASPTEPPAAVVQLESAPANVPEPAPQRSAQVIAFPRRVASTAELRKLRPASSQ